MMYDIVHTEEGDIYLKQGDIQYGACCGQHQKDILIAGKGHYKENPAGGVGAVDYLQDTCPENLLRAIYREFTRDGMKVENVKAENGQIKAIASYEDSEGKG